MAKDTANAIRLLTALELLPLEDISEHAEQWRQDIRETIQELHDGGLPADDPLRYQDGELVSEERYQKRLGIIINSWPSWGKEEKRYARTKTDKDYR
jgi:hypothetical protein